MNEEDIIIDIGEEESASTPAMGTDRIEWGRSTSYNSTFSNYPDNCRLRITIIEGRGYPSLRTYLKLQFSVRISDRGSFTGKATLKIQVGAQNAFSVSIPEQLYQPDTANNVYEYTTSIAASSVNQAVRIYSELQFIEIKSGYNPGFSVVQQDYNIPAVLDNSISVQSIDTSTPYKVTIYFKVSKAVDEPRYVDLLNDGVIIGSVVVPANSTAVDTLVLNDMLPGTYNLSVRVMVGGFLAGSPVAQQFNLTSVVVIPDQIVCSYSGKTHNSFTLHYSNFTNLTNASEAVVNRVLRYTIYVKGSSNVLKSRDYTIAWHVPTLGYSFAAGSDLSPWTTYVVVSELLIYDVSGPTDVLVRTVPLNSIEVTTLGQPGVIDPGHYFKPEFVSYTPSSLMAAVLVKALDIADYDLGPATHILISIFIKGPTGRYRFHKELYWKPGSESSTVFVPSGGNASVIRGNLVIDTELPDDLKNTDLTGYTVKLIMQRATGTNRPTADLHVIDICTADLVAESAM